ncbi:hypothetical protein GOODEAATRI_014166 [Goodea atripinnis]|uniref:Secreted protein n=1 Tax=Goodea atripinnis TaxID=208336 RepID=A0ABV0NDT7_9TELE
MRARICAQWTAPSLLAAGCICLFGKQPHHRPDFCLNRKQNLVQWKDSGSRLHLNPVWFGDKCLPSACGIPEPPSHSALSCIFVVDQCDRGECGKNGSFRSKKMR